MGNCSSLAPHYILHNYPHNIIRVQTCNRGIKAFESNSDLIHCYFVNMSISQSIFAILGCAHHENLQLHEITNYLLHVKKVNLFWSLSPIFCFVYHFGICQNHRRQISGSVRPRMRSIVVISLIAFICWINSL